MTANLITIVDSKIALNHERPGFDAEAMLAALTDFFALADVPLDTPDPRFEAFGSRVAGIAMRIEEILHLEVP